ncbi:hypothetical protein Dimus_030349, partial [Dionaea muscipula]
FFTQHSSPTKLVSIELSMALPGANITLSINPKPLSTSTAGFSPSISSTKLGNSRVISRSHLSLVKCSAEQKDGGELKNALSGIVGERVEELLSREENRALLDRLNQASERVDLARRELEEIEKQKIEAKKTTEYIQLMETRASQVFFTPSLLYTALDGASLLTDCNYNLRLLVSDSDV